MHPKKIEELAAYMRERHNIYLNRQAGKPKPYTDDPILQRVHFCNVFRRYDKTSVYIQNMMLGQAAASKQLEPIAASEQLRASIVGRHVNRPDSIGPVWDAVRKHSMHPSYRKKVEAALQEVPFNAHAYKIHTREGLFSRPGVAAACIQPLKLVAHDLYGCRDLAAAAQVIDPVSNSGFLKYQVLLDLIEARYFDEPFDATNWMNLGGGAWRGMLYLEGGYEYKGELIIGSKWDSTPGRTEQGELHGKILDLTDLIQWQWPEDWEVLSCHDVEFSLCEFDKYKRHQAGGKVKMRVFDGQG